VLSGIEAVRAGLAPHYTVEREIGAGGMAKVYLAEERHPPRKVAIKVMKPSISTARFRERFIREVELTSNLNHPHIVPILAADECLFVPDGPDGLCYYVMPYIEGESLRARLLRTQGLPLPEALQITREMADALGHAHARGIIHRDIKPENILLSSGHALLADFGIARAVSAAGVPQNITNPGELVGSLAYMSPEQLAGEGALDARTDVYSLCCVVHEMLSGSPPLLAVTQPSAKARAGMLQALQSQGVGRAVAGALREALDGGLAPAPADRYGSAAELMAAMEAALRPSLGRRVAALLRISE